MHTASAIALMGLPVAIVLSSLRPVKEKSALYDALESSNGWT
jgi:hypothetical protein